MSNAMNPSRRNRNRRGSEVIEAAFVLPILLALAFGTVEFGHWYFVEHNLQGSAREGARAAIVPGATNDDVNAAVNTIMTASGFDGADYAITTDPGDISGALTGDLVTVTVSSDWTVVGIRPLSMIQAEAVQGVAIMRKE